MYDLGIYSGTSGWVGSWVGFRTLTTEPNRGYQNRPLSVQQAPYTADLQWNRVANLEPSGSKAETLPLGHRGPTPALTMGSILVPPVGLGSVVSARHPTQLPTHPGVPESGLIE
ncbi:hypothetical protein AVEN_55401-1 [Araneus ventricosus]|uniref:Uncharacterized protein n=1 Tax=Araneus ventricosus TaxID=182803 RepID=A0A4Y2CK61_ARAVE|nr:hypothetical protein AVEN_55401-1 [Araneus ventricosus]